MVVEAWRESRETAACHCCSVHPPPLFFPSSFFFFSLRVGRWVVCFHPLNFLFLETWIVGMVKSLWLFIFNFYGICSFIETVDKIWPSDGSCLLFLDWNLLESLARHISFMGLQTAWCSLGTGTSMCFHHCSSEGSNSKHRFSMLCLHENISHPAFAFIINSG